MGRITKNYFYNLAYQLLTILTPIITAPYLSRVLGADNLGIYGYVNSSGNVITTLALLGIYAYGNRQTAYVRDNKDDLNKTFWEIMLLRCILGTVGTAVYFAYAYINGTYSFFFLVYYPYLLAMFLDCSWIFVGLEDMKPAVIKNFVTKLVNVAGVFLLVRKRDDVWIYLLMLAVTTLIANISVYTQLKRYVGRPQADRHNLMTHLKSSVALFLPQLASVFYLQVDKVMLKWLTGTTNQVSFYDQAEKIVTIPLSLITVISTVIMPRIANEFRKGNTERIEQLLVKAGRITLLMAMPMMAGVFCIARQMIPWYLGDEFIPSATAIMVLSPIILLNALSGISGKQYFTATDQTGILLKSYVAAAVMNVAVNAVLIPRYGFVGAAVATLLSSLISVTVQYFCLCRQINVRPLLPTGVKYLLGALIMGAAVTAATYHMNASALTTVIQVAIGALTYMAYLLITRDDLLREGFEAVKSRLKHGKKKKEG